MGRFDLEDLLDPRLSTRTRFLSGAASAWALQIGFTSHCP